MSLSKSAFVRVALLHFRALQFRVDNLIFTVERLKGLIGYGRRNVIFDPGQCIFDGTIAVAVLRSVVRNIGFAIQKCLLLLFVLRCRPCFDTRCLTHGHGIKHSRF